MELAEVPIGCEANNEVLVSNVGAGPLEIEAWKLHEGIDGLYFDLADDGGSNPLPWRLDPGDEVSLGTVVYLPVVVPESRDFGNLVITSSDPGQGELELQVQGSAYEPGETSEIFNAGLHPMDLLFTVDRYSSTVDDLASLQLGFWDFVSVLYGYGIDYHILAVTMLDGCAVTKQPWIDDSYGQSAAEGLLAALLAQEPEGGDSEATQGLLRAKHALSKEALGGCNLDFRRAGAMLHVIGLSDKADTSPGSYDEYVEDLSTITQWPLETVFHGIGHPSSGCNDGTHEPYTGFLEAADQTSGEFVSLCENTWYENMAGSGTALVSRADRSTYVLEGEPDPSSMKVSVADTLLDKGDWSFEETTNSVVLVSAAEPSLADTVRIAYSAVVDCE